MEVEDPLALLVAHLGGFLRRLQLRQGEALQVLGALHHQLEGVGLGQEVLFEFQAEQGQLRMHRPQPVLLAGGQTGAAPLEAAPGLLQQRPRLGRQGFLPLEDRPDPLVQRVVQVDVVLVPGEQGPHRQGHGLERAVGVGLHQGGKDPVHPVQELAGILQRLHRIAEGGGGTDLQDVPDLFVLPPDAGLERRQVVFRLDPGERRRPERGLPFLEEGVLAVRVFWRRGGHGRTVRDQ
jgi:hypothetical protein